MIVFNTKSVRYGTAISPFPLLSLCCVHTMRLEDCATHLDVLELTQMLHKAKTEDRNEDLAKQALESPFVEPDLKKEVHELPMDWSSSPWL